VFFGASHIFPIVQTVFTKFPNATEFSQANWFRYRFRFF
jgi:hypothetical protein